MSFGKGGIGGILGTLAGLAGTAAFPELGIPALAATGGGAFLGSTAEGLARGEKPGQAALQGLEAGGLSAGLTGAGELLAGEPLLSAATPFGGGAASSPFLIPGTDTPLGPGLQTASLPAATDAITAAPLAAPASPTPLAGGPSGAIGGGANIGGPNIDQLTGAAPPFDSLVDRATRPLDFSSEGGAGGGGDFGQKLADWAKTPQGLSTLLGGGVLGTELLSSRGGLPSSYTSPLTAGAGRLTNIASGLNTTGANLTTAGNRNLQAYETGQMPPGAQSALDLATGAAKAHVRSEYAGLGLSGSTMEADALGQVDLQAATEKGKYMTDLINTGLKEVAAGTTAETSAVGADTAANQIYLNLLKANLDNDKTTTEALSRFAAALAGGGLAGSRQA